MGRGCVFGSSPKRLEWPHPELVHWWLLVHSNLDWWMCNNDFFVVRIVANLGSFL
jgi:hypothetical protein